MSVSLADVLFLLNTLKLMKGIVASVSSKCIPSDLWILCFGRQQVCAKHEDLVQLLERKYDTLYGEYGVIVFLYSLLLTKVSLIVVFYYTKFFIICNIIILIISKTMFMVLSSWQSHYESSPGSFDECRTAPSGCRPKTKPDDLGCESACTGCQHLHPPSPFIIITHNPRELQINSIIIVTCWRQRPHICNSLRSSRRQQCCHRANNDNC